MGFRESGISLIAFWRFKVLVSVRSPTISPEGCKVSHSPCIIPPCPKIEEMTPPLFNIILNKYSQMKIIQ